MMKKPEEQILFPDITIDKNITIKPWSFGTLFELSNSLDILLKAADTKGILDIIDTETSISYLTIAKIFTLVNFEVLDIISKTINKSHEEILCFNMNKGVKIALAIFNLNKDIIKNRIKLDTEKKDKSNTSLSEVFCVLLQNNIAKDLDDLKYNFSIDQIYLFYEKVKKVGMEKDRMEAIILANALTYTGQVYSKKDLNSRNKQWTNFMKSLSWERLEERTRKPEFKKVVNLFSSIGIPITKKKGK